MKTSSQIRQMWLDFFKSKGHMVEPGASLVPNNDPTLLWINSGVAALKKYFDGRETPKSKRIVNAQKSIRTNDIENVGYTSRHHTFFEMLGNFSIGDYFRDEAITWAYEFLTSPQWLGFSKDVIYVTYHPSDKDTYQKWQDVGISKDKLVPCEGNFWEIGPGPCGPNTEIFIDRGEAYDPQGLGEKLIREDLDNDRYIEIWNIVFSQYNAKEGVERKNYKELPQKNIDTGSGFERLVCLLQNGETNFDTDLFLPLIRRIEEIAIRPYRDPQDKIAYRVIADHVRATTFALTDGAYFGNEGRSYVLRRLLRRAVRYGKKLGINGAFIYTLVPLVGKIMNDYYPEVLQKADFTAKLIKQEEEKFQSTLNSGEQLLKEYIDQAETKVVPGSIAFKLADTYGFPYELTLEIAEENGFSVNRSEFEVELQAQKERARAARSKTASMHTQSEDLINFKTPSTFLYDTLSTKAKVVGLFKDGVAVNELEEVGQIVFDVTPFYAESGGQISDSGILLFKEEEINVEDVKKAPNKQHLHFVCLNENIKVVLGDEMELVVDARKRGQIVKSHSAAHLLQSALKIVLGNHIAQAGSFVSDELLRFDFNHYQKVETQQLKQIEDIVNQQIELALPGISEELTLEEAKQKGAIALFSEKYGASVRMVSFGDYSIELCGGTHVTNTAQIGIFKIISEESIASGVRRITAQVGYKAYQEFARCQNILENACMQVNVGSVDELEEKLTATINNLSATNKSLGEYKNKYYALKANDVLKNAVDKDGIKTLIQRTDNYPKEFLISLVDIVKSHQTPFFVFLANVSDSVQFICACSPELSKNGIHCGQLLKAAASVCQGQGGGRPDMAQGGGKDITKVDEAIKLIKEKVNL